MRFFGLALLYAIPNLYSEDPVIQVSSTQANQAIASPVVQALQAALHKQGIAYTEMETSPQGLVFRFHSTDQQLLAFDIAKEQLGDTYTVALNLEPATPQWMRRLGAEPMKQGLDLRGGVHFLLEVDVDSVIARRYDGLMKGIGHLLRDNKIRYTSLRRTAEQGVEVQFKDEISERKALDLINKEYTHFLITHTPVNGSNFTYSMYLKLSPIEINEIRQNTLDQTMGILRNRVNELGVGEAVVQQQGATRIGVELPGIQDAVRAKQILGGTATLAFYMVDQEHDPVVAMRNGNRSLFRVNYIKWKVSPFY